MNERQTEITIQIHDWPPIKNEAKSMLAAGHHQSSRVLALPQAAQTAALDTDDISGRYNVDAARVPT
jgi:hypothetical protein